VSLRRAKPAVALAVLSSAAACRAHPPAEAPDPVDARPRVDAGDETNSPPARAAGSRGPRGEGVDPELPAGPPCPAPEARGPGTPPWELRHGFDRCVRGPEGRWWIETNASGRDGWRAAVEFAGVDGSTWTLEVASPVALARRTDGHLVVVDGKSGITLVSPEGSPVWSSTHPECGFVRAVAVGWDHAITLACGFSVVRLDEDGRLQWQVWPFGDNFVGGPWVDRFGSTYVSGDGRVARLDPHGKPYWTVSTGFNRAIGRLVWNEAGHLVFDTSMAERHSDPARSGGYSFYFDPEPNELFELTPTGDVVRRAPWEGAPPTEGWPEVLDVPPDGSYRCPNP
jgi:hypothetical protein